ncbi:MAG: excinuclease ABC subunit UvrC [Rhodospirillaceae bacterium]|jgi:excinuclease ABC subunit C|nr:excinuclease ABC subunit UvrC [Rhodospirillaceae bacterium]MBT5459154.1 excinuclease ABC subunit UvrC [Rhodospirillaceae bacterium]
MTKATENQISEPTKTREPPAAPSLARGVDTIAAALKTLSGSAGVYRMADKDGKPLYVGKAKNLKRRVTAYTRPQALPVRIQRMIAATASVEVIQTHTEVEALLLESNMIKQLKPRYNVLLRDDKSFPFILLTGKSDWPQLIKHRGARSKPGEYFGPFASAGAVNRTLAALQRAFPLRNCSDSIFTSRTRPCLQYQIKRCTAPCVGRISPEDYGAIVDEARDFLTGHSRNIQDALSTRMQDASDATEYESAAIFRDRIQALTQIQAHQDVNVARLGNADVIAIAEGGGLVCVQVFFYRAGQNFGNRTYFPTRAAGLPADQVLAAFIGQFYADKEPPALVLLSEAVPDADLIEAALTLRANRKVTATRPIRGTKRNLIEHALANARESLARRLSESAAQRRLLEGVADAFNLDGPPARIEVYDNSHISGTNPVGAMIVAGPEGFEKPAYRKFNIRDKTLSPGDDYGMMREVMTRRFRRALQEDPDRQSGTWPDLLLIDGGEGQLSSVSEVLTDLAVDDIPVVGISKGPDRDAGRERFHINGRRSFMMAPNDPVLYYLQRLRDEAHRFAIGSHRTRRSQGITRSQLDDIPGVGGLRKRALLHHFGSGRAVGEAGLADLETVSGISRPLAKKIYDHFHADG